MAEKEERILVVKLGGRNCPVLSNDNICVLDYDCEECHAGISRAEAVERMAKANWIAVVCYKNKCTLDSVSQKEWDAEWIKLPKIYKKVYFAGAEAALDELLDNSENIS